MNDNDLNEFLRLNNSVASGSSSNPHSVSCTCSDCINKFIIEPFRLKYGEANFQTDIRNYLQLSMDNQPGTSSGMVGSNSQLNQRKRQLGPRGSDYTTMAQFFKADVEGYNLLAEEIEKVGRPFFEYVNGKAIHNSGRYISDVFLFRGRRERDRAVEILRAYGGSRRNGMFGISVESDHIHIIHDCSYSGRNCRCTFKEKIEPFGQFGPDRKFNKPLHEFTRTDWYDVFIYFFLAKRGIRDLWFRGKSWEVPSDGKWYIVNNSNDLNTKYFLQLNWYDGKKSTTLGDKWWESKIAGATVTVNDKQIKELVEQLLAQVTIRFMAKNPTLKENTRTSNYKRKRYS